MSDDDHSIRGEPHLTHKRAESPNARNEPALGACAPIRDDEERAHHNVWDEPWAKRIGLALPEDAIDYARWYRAQLEATSAATSLLVCAALALVGGLLALVGTMFSGQIAPFFPLISVVVIGPAIEEVMKITAVAVVLERRPYLFANALVLFVAVVASALTFAVVENLMYLNVYVQNPSPSLIQWRWTVCTVLHVGATLIAGLGIRRMWYLSRSTFTKPEYKNVMPYLIAAVVVHGAYNLFATLYEGFFKPF